MDMTPEAHRPESGLLRAGKNTAVAVKPILRIRDYRAIAGFCRYFNERAAPENKTCAYVLKSDAYGFGLQETAEILHKNGARVFFTSDVWEAIDIRAALGEAADIYTLHGYDADYAGLYQAHNIAPVLNTLSELTAFNRVCRQKNVRAKAALQLDSGMNRCGLDDGETLRLAENPDLADHIDLRFYMTHLHSVRLHSAQQEDSIRQVNRFLDVVRNLPPRPLSITATHGTLFMDHNPNLRMRQAVQRIGIGAFGDIPGKTIAFHVKAKIISCRSVAQGETVGYDATYTAQKPMTLAILDIGYGDGYPAQLAGKGAHVGIGGRKAPVIGKISMNMTCVDVSDIPADMLAGNRYAEIVGKTIDLKDLAARAGTTPEDVMISLGRQNRRVQDIKIREREP